MKSLRTQLLTYIWCTLLVVGAVSSVISYVVSRRDTNELLDYQMEQIAAVLGATQFDAGHRGDGAQPLDGGGDFEDTYVIRVADSANRTLYASRPEVAGLAIDWQGFRTLRIGAADYRVFATQSSSQRIAVGQQLEVRQEAATQSALLALIPILLLIPILGAVITLVVRRQLRPLSDATALVAGRQSLDLTPLPGDQLPREIFPLVDEINRLLARLRDATELEHRFITDAAHALRTPLTALQLQADVLEGTTDPVQRAARVSDLRAGIRRNVRLANQLLLLARREPVHVANAIDLDAALAEACALYAPIAGATAVRLTLDAHSGAMLRAGERQLAQLAGNLIDNALRHSPSGATVSVLARRDEHGVLLQVCDEGPGLSDEQLQRVFERFYRVPGDSTEGSGLGLAVVNEMATQIGATVNLTNRADRSGLIAAVRFPASALVDPTPATASTP